MLAWLTIFCPRSHTLRAQTNRYPKRLSRMPMRTTKSSVQSGFCAVVWSLANHLRNCIAAPIKPRCRGVQLDWVALVLHSQPRWCCQFPAVGLLSVQFPWLLMLRARGVGTITWSQAAPAIAIDPADSTGNTVYIGGAQGGVWDVNQCNHQRRQQRQLHGAHRRPGYAFERVDRNSIGEFQSPPKCDSGGHRRG